MPPSRPAAGPPELVAAECPYCARRQLFRRTQVGTLVVCRTDAAQFVLKKVAPFGRKQWDADVPLRLRRDALRLLREPGTLRQARCVALMVAKTAFAGQRNPWFRMAVAAGEELARGGETSRPIGEIVAGLGWFGVESARPDAWREVGSRCVEVAPSLDLPATDVAEANAVAAALREIVPNPFRPPAVRPEWRTSAVLALAASARHADDWGVLPILADALEEAGCSERPLLDHLRGPGPYALGCWALEAVAAG